MPSTYGDTTYLTCAETAKLARAALKKAFPGVKFSVRSDGCIRISWIDGPTAESVDAVVKCYAGGRFDGNIDYAYNVSHWLLPDGSAIVARSEGTENQRSYHAPVNNAAPEGAIKVSFGARFVFTDRRISPELRSKVVRDICNDFGLSPLAFSVVAGYDGGSYVQGACDVPQLGTDMSTYSHRVLCKLAA
jgi:hypothetical protein